MPLSLPQLTLALFDGAHMDLSDFVAGPNELLLNALTQWRAGRGPWYLMVWGHSATGKSHLLEGTVRALGQVEGRVMYIPLRDTLAHGAGILEGLDSVEYVVIDDIHLAAGNDAWEHGLFALFNQLQNAGRRLFVSSAHALRATEFGLDDLSSRLSAGLIFQVKELADADKQAVLQQRAARRGLTMSENVGRYLISHLQRDMGELNAVFERIDAASLSAGREITIPFIRDVLEID